MTAYKFEDKRATIGGFVGTAIVFGGAAVLIGERYGVADGLKMLVVFLLPAWLLLTLAFYLTMDLHFDEAGLSKVAFGRVWQRLTWAQLRLVRLYFAPSASGTGKSTTIHLYPSVAPRFRLMPAGRMSFTANMLGARQFVSQLNAVILKNRIPVEDQRTEPTTTAREVLLDQPRRQS